MLLCVIAGCFHFCWLDAGLLYMQVGWDWQKLGSLGPIGLFCFSPFTSKLADRSLFYRLTYYVHPLWRLVLRCETKGQMVSKGNMKARLYTWGRLSICRVQIFCLQLWFIAQQLLPSFCSSRGIKHLVSTRDKRKFMLHSEIVHLPFVSWLRIRLLTYQRTGGI